MNYSVDNLLDVLEQATAAEWREGTSWYPRANAFVRGLAEKHDLDVVVVAAVVAALSPMNKWGQNCKDAETLIGAWADGNLTADDVKVCTFHKNKAKAWAILESGDPGLLSGDKVTSFASNLLGNLDEITIDRHAFNACIGQREIIGDTGLTVTSKRNRLAADCYRAAAKMVGVAPAQLQAIIWLTWRRVNVPTRYRDD